MKNRLLVGLMAFGLGIFIVGSSNAGPIEAIRSKSILDFNFQIPLPGLPLKISGADVAAGKLIPTYLTALYNFLVRAAAIFAVLMISYAGIRWLTAGGDSSRVQEAQKIIGDSLIGLVLALGSFSFLYTINPELVSTKNTQLASINNMSLDLQPLKIKKSRSPAATKTSPAGAGKAEEDAHGSCCVVLKNGAMETLVGITSQDECEERAIMNMTLLENVYVCDETPETLRASDKIDVCETHKNDGFAGCASLMSSIASRTPDKNIVGKCCYNWRDDKGNSIGAASALGPRTACLDKISTSVTDQWFCKTDRVDDKICGTNDDRDRTDSFSAHGPWLLDTVCKDAEWVYKAGKKL